MFQGEKPPQEPDGKVKRFFKKYFLEGNPKIIWPKVRKF